MYKIVKSNKYLPSFVDRDMLIRYHLGLGVGHISARPICEERGMNTSDVEDIEVSDDENVLPASKATSIMEAEDEDSLFSGSEDHDGRSIYSVDLDENEGSEETDGDEGSTGNESEEALDPMQGMYGSQCDK